MGRERSQKCWRIRRIITAEEAVAIKAIARNLCICALVWCVVIAGWLCSGFDRYSSSAAVADLKAELSVLYGEEYTGKRIPTGTEEMAFVIEARSWFLTNWDLRNFLGIDYRYDCKVIITTHHDSGAVTTVTYTHPGVDPMGWDEKFERAYLVWDEKA